jgi:hypothetical protein
MNEKIKELIVQAQKEVWGNSPFNGSPEFEGYELDAEKFAELIVKECIGVVEGGSFLHDQAPTAIFAKECSGAIKRHFGVEE